MNKDRLKKLLYDLELEYKDIEESLKFIQVYSDNELLKKELSNSLKYKYLSMFILYEDFISMLLKEYNIFVYLYIFPHNTYNNHLIAVYHS